jgi:hypothetical protein
MSSGFFIEQIQDQEDTRELDVTIIWFAAGVTGIWQFSAEVLPKASPASSAHSSKKAKKALT